MLCGMWHACFMLNCARTKNCMEDRLGIDGRSCNIVVDKVFAREVRLSGPLEASPPNGEDAAQNSFNWKYVISAFTFFRKNTWFYATRWTHYTEEFSLRTCSCILIMLTLTNVW